MTTTTVAAPASIPGPYSTSAVDWIAANVVTDMMIDKAIRASWRSRKNRDQATYRALVTDPGRRREARRNIAIGIRCGSYWPFYA